MSTPPSRPTPPTGAPQSPGRDREEPELRREDDIPSTQQPPAAEGASDTKTIAPEDQSGG